MFRLMAAPATEMDSSCSHRTSADRELEETNKKQEQLHGMSRASRGQSVRDIRFKCSNQLQIDWHIYI